MVSDLLRMKCESLVVRGSSKRKEEHLRPNGEEIQLWHGQFRREEKWIEVEIKEMGVEKVKGTQTETSYDNVQCLIFHRRRGYHNSNLKERKKRGVWLQEREKKEVKRQ